MQIFSPSFLVAATLVGIGATLVTDAWTWLRARLLRVPALDYALLGRWLLHMRHGQWHHPAITAAPAQPAERPLGWLLHYLIGIVFAAVLLAWQGAAPSLVACLLWGLATVVFPFFIMQPSWGAGIAASRTPAPWRARCHSMVLHLVFGAGLYLSSCLWQAAQAAQSAP